MAGASDAADSSRISVADSTTTDDIQAHDHLLPTPAQV